MCADLDVSGAPFELVVCPKPSAVDDFFTTPVDIPLSDDVTTNDSNPSGNLLTTSLVSGVSNGILTFNSDGTFTYVPNPGFIGQDVFVYELCDNSLTPNQCSQASATITVDGCNVDAGTLTSIKTRYNSSEEVLLSRPLRTGTSMYQPDILPFLSLRPEQDW